MGGHSAPPAVAATQHGQLACQVPEFQSSVKFFDESARNREAKIGLVVSQCNAEFLSRYLTVGPLFVVGDKRHNQLQIMYLAVIDRIGMPPALGGSRAKR